ASCVWNSMFSPISRRSIASTPDSVSFTLSTRGCSTCCRLKASSWRVSVADLLDVAAVFVRRIVGGMVGEKQRGVALDHREHVVEVMRHAAGELADRVHLLRLPQLRLELQ